MAQWPTPNPQGRGGYGGYGGGGGYGRYNRDDRRAQNTAHNPYEVQLPRFITHIDSNENDPEDSSIIMVDQRDDRMVSPFQAWLVSEIMANAASSINVLTERDQVMPPSSGYHLALFANYTLDGIKAVLAISIESNTGNTCAGWDSDTARALAHPAFQPFTWPMLRDTSASYTDVKVYNGNEILFHWVLRGFRSDTDLTVQLQFVDELLVREVCKGQPRLSVVVAVFVGWRVSVLSFECGGRTYSIGPGGAVVSGDSARSRFELRVCQRATDDAYGNDADRIEFRYRDANNRIDLKCSRTSVPGTWLTVSHISGPTLIQTIRSVRDNRARVEGPEQTEQFAQLAAIHKGWWDASIAASEDEVGSVIIFLEDLEEGNFHVQSRSKLMVRGQQIVPTRALAEMSHEAGVAAPSGPPSLTAQAWKSSVSAAEGSAAAGSAAGSSQLSIQQQAGFELNQRALSSTLANEGTGGHEVDPQRDQARQDRRFARSTASLTPQIFADHMDRRYYNETTATIEEVDPVVPPAYVHDDPRPQRPAPTKVPIITTTASGSGATGSDQAPQEKPVIEESTAPQPATEPRSLTPATPRSTEEGKMG